MAKRHRLSSMIKRLPEVVAQLRPVNALYPVGNNLTENKLITRPQDLVSHKTCTFDKLTHFSRLLLKADNRFAW